MKVQELLMNIYNSDFNAFEALEVKHYIPIMQKKSFVNDVIAECTDEIDGFVSADRFKMDIYFSMKALGLYTNLEIAEDFDGMIEQYDMLSENNTLNNIFNLFKNDYSAMRSVLDNLLNELLIQNSIDMQVVKLSNKIMSVISTLENVDFESILSNINIPELIGNLNIEN